MASYAIGMAEFLLLIIALLENLAKPLVKQLFSHVGIIIASHIHECEKRSEDEPPVGYF